MKLPLKPIWQAKDVRKDGTSVVFIQYCFSGEKRTILNSKIAIPPKYWDKKRLAISQNMPEAFGTVDQLNKALRQKLRLAEDLAELASRKKVTNVGQFVKAAFDAGLDPEILENDFGKIKELAGEKEKDAINLDVYFQIDEYIKAKKNKVSKATVTVFENMKAHLKAFETFRRKPIF